MAKAIPKLRKHKHNLMVCPATRSRQAIIKIDKQEVESYLGDPIILLNRVSKYSMKEFQGVGFIYIAERLANARPLFHNDYVVCLQKNDKPKSDVLIRLNNIPISCKQNVDKSVYLEAYAKAFNSEKDLLSTFGFTKRTFMCFLGEESDKTPTSIMINGEVTARKLGDISNCISKLLDFLEAEVNKALTNELVNSSQSNSDETN